MDPTDVARLRVVHVAGDVDPETMTQVCLRCGQVLLTLEEYFKPDMNGRVGTHWSEGQAVTFTYGEHGEIKRREHGHGYGAYLCAGKVNEPA